MLRAITGAEVGELGKRDGSEVVGEEVAAAFAIGDDEETAALIEPAGRGADEVVRVAAVVREARERAAGERVARGRERVAPEAPGVGAGRNLGVGGHGARR